MPTCPFCDSPMPPPHRGRPTCPGCLRRFHWHNGRLDPLAQKQAPRRLVPFGLGLLGPRWRAHIVQ